MQTLILTKVLSSLGHEVIILCYFEHNDAVIAELKFSGASVTLLDLSRKKGFLMIFLILRNEIIATKPDIVHVQYMSPGALPILAAKLAGAKKVFALVHQPWTKSHGIKAKILLRAASCLTTRFMAVSQNAENSWFGTSSLFDEKKPSPEWEQHFTIYNSVDTNSIKDICEKVDIQLLKSHLGIPVGSIVVGTVSRLRFEKGIDLLLDSFISLIPEKPNIHLLIVGTGPDEEELKKKAVNSKASEVITFAGDAEWPTAIGLMSVIDIFVVPSRFEGFGLSALEAMAVGKPIIASKCFGLKEIVNHEESGLLFTVGNTMELTDALKCLIDNADLREKLGKESKKRSSKFNIDSFREKIKKIYQ